MTSRSSEMGPASAGPLHLDREQVFAALDAMVGKEVEVHSLEGELLWVRVTGTLSGPNPEDRYDAESGAEFGEECWRHYWITSDDGTIMLTGFKLASGYWGDSLSGSPLILNDGMVWIQEAVDA